MDVVIRTEIFQRLMSASRVKSKSTSAMYRPYNTYNSLKIQNNRPEMESTRSSFFRSPSVRTPRHRLVRSAKESSLGTPSMIFRQLCSLRQELKTSMVSRSPSYDYSRQAFPARYKYVKCARKASGYSSFFVNTQSNALPLTHYIQVPQQTNCKRTPKIHTQFQTQMCSKPKLKTPINSRAKGKASVKGKWSDRSVFDTITPWDTMEDYQ